MWVRALVFSERQLGAAVEKPLLREAQGQAMTALMGKL